MTAHLDLRILPCLVYRVLSRTVHSPLQARLGYQVADCSTLRLDDYLAAADFRGL